MPIRVFLSVSRKDDVPRDLIRGWLKDAGFDIKTDTGKDRTDEVHKEISRNLNNCDVLVPLITPDWLKSHECRHEAVMAHERLIPIVPVLFEGIDKDELYYFLKEATRVSFEKGHAFTAQSELIKILKNARIPDWQAAVLRDVRSIRDAVVKDDISAWRSSLLAAHVSDLTTISGKLTKDDSVALDVGHDSNYLRFAAPLFRRADKIQAVCVASISSFWTNRQYRSNAIQYLCEQGRSANSISRLFVFRYPDEVNYYKNICQAHHDVYGARGGSNGVFVCSEDSFCSLLAHAHVSREEALQEDFGILSFQNPRERIYATLNAREFGVQDYPERGANALKLRVIEKMFAQFEYLREGEVDDATGIGRWSPEWPRHESRFGTALDKVFAGRVPALRHYVLMNPHGNADRLETYLADLAKKFSENKDLVIRRIAINKLRRVPAVDGRFGARLAIDDSFTHSFFLEFKDSSDLMKYYQNHDHSVQRERLYRLLNPAIAPEFDKLSSANEEKRSQGFARIERIMQRKHICRYDVDYYEPIDVIVRRAGIPFSVADFEVTPGSSSLSAAAARMARISESRSSKPPPRRRRK
jgi:hypothetical protein